MVEKKRRGRPAMVMPAPLYASLLQIYGDLVSTRRGLLSKHFMCLGHQVLLGMKEKDIPLPRLLGFGTAATRESGQDGAREQGRKRKLPGDAPGAANGLPPAVQPGLCLTVLMMAYTTATNGPMPMTYDPIWLIISTILPPPYSV